MKLRGARRGEASLEPPPGYYGAGGAAPDVIQRGLILDWVVVGGSCGGWRVESRSGTQAVLVRGQPVNHVLHAFLTVFSCFVWGAVWVAVALTNKVERVALTVDAQGHVVSVGGP